MSGGLRTSVKANIIAKRVTLAVDTNIVHHEKNEAINTKLQSFNLKSFHFNELKTTTMNFRPDCILGQDGLGCVYKGWINENSFTATKPGTGIAIVIKRFSQLRTLQSHKDWSMEVSCLGQLGHPNLVKMIGYCLEDGMRVLVHEFIPQGSLNMHLYEITGASHFPRLSWNLRMKIALGAAKGLAFLHSNEAKVIYGDFKTSKILLDSDYNAKLYGYGAAMERLHGYRSHVSEEDMAMYEEGFFGYAAASVYAAPEKSKDVYSFENHSTPKSDVYSFGVVLLEIVSGRQAPLREKCMVELVNNKALQGGSANFANFSCKRKVGQIFDAHIDGRYSKDEALKVLKLVIQCMSVEPESRPDMSEVVEVLEQLQSSK